MNVGLKLSTWKRSSETTLAEAPDLVPMIRVPVTNFTVLFAFESTR